MSPEKLEVGRLRILSFPIDSCPFLVTYQISLGNNLPGRNLGNMTQCFEKKLDVSQKSEGEPFSQKAMKYSLENDALVQMILLQKVRLFRFQPLIFGGVEVQSNYFWKPQKLEIGFFPSFGPYRPHTQEEASPLLNGNHGWIFPHRKKQNLHI